MEIDGLGRVDVQMIRATLGPQRRVQAPRHSLTRQREAVPGRLNEIVAGLGKDKVDRSALFSSDAEWRKLRARPRRTRARDE